MGSWLLAIFHLFALGIPSTSLMTLHECVFGHEIKKVTPTERKTRKGNRTIKVDTKQRENMRSQV